MSATAPPRPLLSPRLRRALEVVYAIEGVVAVRLWEWPGTVALGIATAPPGNDETVRRAERAVSSLREPGERWEFGLMDAELATTPPAAPSETDATSAAPIAALAKPGK